MVVVPILSFRAPTEYVSLEMPSSRGCPRARYSFDTRVEMSSCLRLVTRHTPVPHLLVRGRDLVSNQDRNSSEDLHDYVLEDLLKAERVMCSESFLQRTFHHSFVQLLFCNIQVQVQNREQRGDHVSEGPFEMQSFHCVKSFMDTTNIQQTLLLRV